MKAEHEARRDIVDVARRMYGRGYIAGTDGNLSVRLDEGRVLATPSGVCKGDLEPSDLVVTDMDGRVIDGTGRPSSELRIHISAYRVRPDIGAVVHAHPKATVAHSLANISLVPTIIPETVFTLGVIAETEYGTPGSEALAEGMAEVLRCHDAVVMERHGTITQGADVYQAFYRLESLEHASQILYMARTLGNVEPIPSSEVEHLFDVAQRAGLRPPLRANGGGADEPAEGTSHDPEELVEWLVRRVLDRLGVEGG